jgi:hypothetical protein
MSWVMIQTNKSFRSSNAVHYYTALVAILVVIFGFVFNQSVKKQIDKALDFRERWFGAFWVCVVVICALAIRYTWLNIEEIVKSGFRIWERLVVLSVSNGIKIRGSALQATVITHNLSETEIKVIYLIDIGPVRKDFADLDLKKRILADGQELEVGVPFTIMQMLKPAMFAPMKNFDYQLERHVVDSLVDKLVQNTSINGYRFGWKTIKRRNIEEMWPESPISMEIVISGVVNNAIYHHEHSVSFYPYNEHQLMRLLGVSKLADINP